MCCSQKDVYRKKLLHLHQNMRANGLFDVTKVTMIDCNRYILSLFKKNQYRHRTTKTTRKRIIFTVVSTFAVDVGIMLQTESQINYFQLLKAKNGRVLYTETHAPS